MPVSARTAKTLVSGVRSTLMALALCASDSPIKSQKIVKPRAPVFSQTQRMLWCGM